ncbi:MAG TPA: tetratricopeptide repeat protein [Micropepsaceae bacterium]|nr:tetratricopeptide repeat protein [Micropepsaceae bacterium]
MAQRTASHSLREGLVLHEKGRISEAAAIYRGIVARNPENAEALHLLGVAELQLRNPAEAAGLLTRAANIDRRNALYLSNLGLALSHLGRFDEALAQFDGSLAIHPNSANTQSHRGNTLRSLGRLDQALAAYARALAINPSHADALNNRGAVLADLKRSDEALTSFNRALSADANHAGALSNRGALLVRLNRHAEAVPDLDRAHTLDPGNAAVLNNRGNALAGLKRYDAALADFDQALAIDHQSPDPWFNRATVLCELHRFDESILSAERCLALAPKRIDALLLHADCLRRLNRSEQALRTYDHILQLAPDHAGALVSRAHLRSELGQLELALAGYQQAMAIAPGEELLPGWRCFCKLKLCDWRGLAGEIAFVEQAVRRGEPVCSPAVLLAMSDDPMLLRQCAEAYTRKHFTPGSDPLPAPSENGRIRLGYFSADFHDHATAWLTAGLFEQHDKSRFEVFAFSFGPPARDSMRRRLEPCFDKFFEIGEMSDADAVRLARHCSLSLAIDMKGFTEGSRTQIFAQRVAPVQVNYLGFPGTMGASDIDYLIADRNVVPEAAVRFYAEKIAWLPDSYQPNDQLHDGSISPPTRRQYGLPEQAFVYCCFNASYKITPAIFAIWMRLLGRVPDSVLWLYEEHPAAAKNLRAEAKVRGIDPERLIFAKRAGHDEHLARHGMADLFLDTLPYGAHTTASDALRAGLPLLTCTGGAFQGRVATSLLHAAGMLELITGTLEEYETAALALAQNPEKLRASRKKLMAHLGQTALFDPVGYTRNLESAFCVMWDRHRRDLPPESFSIATKSFAGSLPQS